MMLPCEYCGRLTNAEIFASLGVPPCCRNCRHIPLVIGTLAGLLFVVVIFCLMFGGRC